MISNCVRSKKFQTVLCVMHHGSLDQARNIDPNIYGLLPKSLSAVKHYMSDAQNDPVSWINTNGFKLVCLDVDGTIVENNTSSDLLPEARELLKSLDSHNVRIALVTNQGAVGLRHWMQTNSFGDPSSLPSQDDVEKRIEKIVSHIKEVYTRDFQVLMAFRYQSKGDASSGKAPRWGPVPFNCKTDPRWQQDWRKPGPGMINAAMKKAGISMFERNKVLMIGDMDADEGAAKAAGVKFKRVPEFFQALKPVKSPVKCGSVDNASEVENENQQISPTAKRPKLEDVT